MLFQPTWGGRWGMVRITIHQVHPEVLYRFEAAVGAGRVSGPRTVKNPNARPLWAFVCASFEGAQWITCCMWPWLSSVKRKQMAGALKDYTIFRELTAKKEDK